MISKKSKIIIVYENFLYGGTSTHLINLLNSQYFKNLDVIIITNTIINQLKILKSIAKISILFFSIH